ncbi:zinc c6 finger domain protein [Ophiostoma piceae UAMH 11346]|uniref:Zinc c6 finger domain protein n=1 Tax=Ophiostoma piceae (strain UAMH 11346) TaxID=1262450 RepID=S3D2F6_OPHP1|nr:zinc c6 finger domain protein [Ophiostoma piceae UAMH 11346]
MKKSRYAASRQKACQACVAAKAKCDRQPRCSRCTARDLACSYLGRQIGDQNGSRGNGAGGISHTHMGTHSPIQESTGGSGDGPSPGSSGTTSTPSRADDDSSSYPSLSDSSVAHGDLICPINANGISIRWMNAYVPTSPDQTTKTYLPATINYIRQMLKSYAGMAIRGKLPPFIHSAQLGNGGSSPVPASPTRHTSSDAIVVCLSLARICDTSSSATPMNKSAVTAAASAAALVIKREMDRLYTLVKQWQSQSQAHGQSSIAPGGDYLVSLAIFQAYLLYALILFFHLEHQADPFLRQAIVALQEIACTSARHGLVCSPRQPTPSRMAWVVAEAKRRTLYIMYLFDSVLSAHDGLPTYLGVELRGLPAPSSKALWQAQSVAEWKQAYTASVRDWATGITPTESTDATDHGLCIDELWAPPVGTNSASLARRRRRVDQWLEGIDEYGVMLYAVTSCTHGV